MKILIVDDESRKLKKMESTFRSIEGIADDNIIHVLDLNSARKILSNQYIDLLILDLNIPEILGDIENNDEIAGLNFIDEIIEIDKYIKPKDIIIVTEYEELLNKCLDADRKITFPILRYDESSNEWENVLKSKIIYNLIYERNNKQENPSYNYEVAIITAVEVESKAVNKLYEGWQKQCFQNDPAIYYTNNFYSGDKKYRIVTAQQSEMGMTAAATLTCKILHHFRPKYIIMVGIAAGIGDNKNLGDIIIASEVWNYSSGKYVKHSEGKDLIQFSPDIKSFPLDPGICGQVRMDYSNILFSIKRNWNNEINNDLKLVIGPLACGNAVVANEEIVKQLIQAHSRKTVGLDMESYGMFYATINGYGLKAIPICIKSICDFADEKKGDGYQNYAAYTSASFAKYLIEEVIKFY